MNTSDLQTIAAAPGAGKWHTAPRSLHPSAEALGRFARGAASREEAMQVVAHLLGCCPACGRTVSGAARLTGPADRSGLAW
jgi:hypothetical protein